MAFQRRKQGGGGNKPVMSVALSAKQGREYIKGPSFGFWPNEEGGPAFRGTLKDKYLEAVLEFLTNAYEAGLPVSLAMFDNSEQAPSGGGFKKSGGFKPSGGGFQKKANPFKQQGEPEENEEQQDDRPF